MQDRETDTYWSIMNGKAVGGPMAGTQLEMLALGEKMRWQDWLRKYPDTFVLSVDGFEDDLNPYLNYFLSSQGFRGAAARDPRMETKEPVFAFHFDGKSYAVSHKEIEGGKAYESGKTKLFLCRPAGASLFNSTAAYQSTTAGFKKVKGQWLHTGSGCAYEPGDAAFKGAEQSCPKRLKGFDTFWYNWSLSNPETGILKNDSSPI